MEVKNGTEANSRKKGVVEAVLPSLDDLPDTINAEEAKRIIEAAEQLQSERKEPLNKSNLKRAVAQLERRVRKNEELRIQHPDEPLKFLKTEVDLDEEVKRFKQLSVSPELLNEFASLNGLQLFIGLLGHQNTDIAIEVVDVLSDLTDPNNIGEADDPLSFVNQLLKLQPAQVLVDTLLRIKEDESEEDYKGVTNILQTLENLADLHPQTCETYAKNTRLVQWLIQRIRHGLASKHSKQSQPSARNADINKPFTLDPNRVYASEILSIILQNCVSFRTWLARRDGVDGIDRLLRAIALYRKRNPMCADEEEFVSNNFSCLCSLLLVPANQTTFGQAQGLELMIRMMKERNFSYTLALTLTSFALQKHPANCKIFVEKMGLKSLFGILMRKGVSTKPHTAAEKTEDEHVTSILNSLGQYCTDVPLARLVNKFTEIRCEKLERILEMHEKYNSVLKAPIRRTKDPETLKIDKELDIDDEEESYLDRCEKGLCILQQIDLLLLKLVNMGNKMLRQKVFSLILIKGVNVKEIEVVIKEYVEHLDKVLAAEERRLVTESLSEFLESWESKEKEA